MSLFRNKVILLIAVAILGSFAATSYFPAEAPRLVAVPQDDPHQMNLDVPYLNEAPDNIWSGPWKNACEEATMVMVDRFYLGEKSINIRDGKAFMQKLFDAQDIRYGSNANSDADRMAYLINSELSFSGRVVRNPTLDAIKKELREGRPVIALHRGFDLHNKNIPFLATGSSYHTTVIKGYDDDLGQFITNDPGDSIAGADHPYGYDVFMNSLHDYDYDARLANRPPVVIFTTKTK